ncbi:hypothetical protein B0T18DRAFT_422144 [Schizothecium vesticola]|uniref:Uncharacterized protein n=1 Tax=Schizothecium vesticola TaxID=314040 RepID=A0AA40BQK0_9PEZI|nr:hypothetical protein B0T18DRAFT_422144 [Schizothecium vesticola]
MDLEQRINPLGFDILLDNQSKPIPCKVRSYLPWRQRACVCRVNDMHPSAVELTIINLQPAGTLSRFFLILYQTPSCMYARLPCPWAYLRDPRLHSRWHGNQASDTYPHKPTPTHGPAYGVGTCQSRDLHRCGRNRAGCQRWLSMVSYPGRPRPKGYQGFESAVEEEAVQVQLRKDDSDFIFISPSTHHRHTEYPPDVIRW